MLNWTELESEKNYNLWTYIHNKLEFAPYADKHKIVRLSAPIKIFDLSFNFDENYSHEGYLDLLEKAVNIFRKVANKNNLYALKWEGSGYTFDPYKPFELDHLGDWLVDFYPNGDHTFFFSFNFDDGVFSDGIHHTLTFFGENMLRALEENMPLLFKKQQ